MSSNTHALPFLLPLEVTTKLIPFCKDQNVALLSLATVTTNKANLEI